MVYVLNIDGQPLMPTERHGKVRRLLKNKKAKVVKRCPFTIQLLYPTTNFNQEISLGIDAGSKHIGVSAATKSKVLYEAVVALRQEIELKAKRRYIKGEPIRSMEEFAQCKDTLLYWFDHPVHVEILKSLQYRTLEKFISSGMLYTAILKEK